MGVRISVRNRSVQGREANRRRAGFRRKRTPPVGLMGKALPPGVLMPAHDSA